MSGSTDLSKIFQDYHENSSAVRELLDELEKTLRKDELEKTLRNYPSVISQTTLAQWKDDFRNLPEEVPKDVWLRVTGQDEMEREHFLRFARDVPSLIRVTDDSRLDDADDLIKQDVPKDVWLRVIGQDEVEQERFLRFARELPFFNDVTCSDGQDEVEQERFLRFARELPFFVDVTCSDDSRSDETSSDDLMTQNTPMEVRRPENGQEDVPSEDSDSSDSDFSFFMARSSHDSDDLMKQNEPVPLVVKVVSDEKMKLMETTQAIDLSKDMDNFFVARRYRRQSATTQLNIRYQSDICSYSRQIQVHRFDNRPGNASKRINDTFQQEFNRYIDEQLRSRVNIVSSGIMDCAKQAMIESVVTPVIKQRVAEYVLRNLDGMLRASLHELSFIINDAVEAANDKVMEVVGEKFGYSSRVWKWFNSWYCNDCKSFCELWSDSEWWIHGPNALEPEYMKILDFVAECLLFEIRKSLTKEVLEKYSVKGESWETLRDDLVSEMLRKLRELGFSVPSSIENEKMILQSILNVTKDIQDIFSHEINSSVLSGMQNVRMEEHFKKAIFEALRDFFIDEQIEGHLNNKWWVAHTANAYMRIIKNANIGNFVSETVPARIETKLTELSQDTKEDIDVTPMVKTMKDIFLRSFRIRRAPYLALGGQGSEAISFHRSYACEVAMRNEILMSLNHRHLQPLLGVQMTLDASECSMRLFYNETLTNCKQLLSTGDASSSTIFISFPERLSLLRDVIEGLCYLHEHNITHGNIRLDSVLIKDVAERRIGCRTALLANAAPWPTPRWRPGSDMLFEAPELCHLPVDVFAFGVLLWYIVKEDSCRSDVEGYKAWLLPIPDSPSGAEDLWDVFRRCCEQKPENRTTAKDVRQRLQEIAKHLAPKEYNCRGVYSRKILQT